MKPRLFNGTEWIEFDTVEEHDAYIASLPVPERQIDYKELVQKRIKIGQQVIIEYLADNAAINLTMEQSIQQLTKFQTVKAFLEVGNIEDSITIITGIATDDVFTPERKEKYLQLLNEI